MKPIRVKKTPKTSFNKDRRPSKLLLDQIEHLEWAALPAWQRKPHLMERYQIKRVKTEQQAAERIAQLTEMVMKANDDSAPPPLPGERPTVTLPPLPKTPRKAKKAAKTRKTAKTPRARKAATAPKKKTVRGQR